MSSVAIIKEILEKDRKAREFELGALSSADKVDLTGVAWLSSPFADNGIASGYLEGIKGRYLYIHAPPAMNYLGDLMNFQVFISLSVQSSEMEALSEESQSALELETTSGVLMNVKFSDFFIEEGGARMIKLEQLSFANQNKPFFKVYQELILLKEEAVSVRSSIAKRV